MTVQTFAPASSAQSSSAPISFIHRYEPATGPATEPNPAPLLLLHGTGGDENDLIDLGRALSPGAALLAPRGRVLEGGMPRFFRRLAEGVFDEADVVRRANELADFVAEARAGYGLAPPLAVGFSNGANVAAAILMLRPGTLAGAVLLRAMPPLGAPPAADLAGVPVLLLSGTADPIVPAAAAARLAVQLGEAGAAVEHAAVPAGHGLTRLDLDRARAWLARRAASARDFAEAVGASR
jgi:phospholipase/carboxylesterase